MCSLLEWRMTPPTVHSFVYDACAFVDPSSRARVQGRAVVYADLSWSHADFLSWSLPVVAVAAVRATQGCFNCTSTGVFGDRTCQKKHTPYENLRRDDHPSKNEPKRVETDRDMSLES